ncbi:hypothetical protein H5410_055779 [Solanum commersonii]|uniref:Uncharacterized protein n=1 Tax=Solanum commersonii TaxID=4109 RepID=A0A9J5WJQ3_SOLCO|nr:hypothetical protein H5410_055779 [Solanum commersonii]
MEPRVTAINLSYGGRSLVKGSHLCSRAWRNRKIRTFLTGHVMRHRPRQNVYSFLPSDEGDHGDRFLLSLCYVGLRWRALNEFLWDQKFEDDVIQVNDEAKQFLDFVDRVKSTLAKGKRTNAIESNVNKFRNPLLEFENPSGKSASEPRGKERGRGPLDSKERGKVSLVFYDLSKTFRGCVTAVRMLRYRCRKVKIGFVPGHGDMLDWIKGCFVDSII